LNEWDRKGLGKFRANTNSQQLLLLTAVMKAQLPPRNRLEVDELYAIGCMTGLAPDCFPSPFLFVFVFSVFLSISLLDNIGPRGLSQTGKIPEAEGFCWPLQKC
jgi:hypothetical protein